MISPVKKEINDFIAVVEQGSFSKAADYLGVKQAGLSKSIARLEDELNHRLIIRGPRSASPTEAGSIFYHQSKNLQKGWTEALEKASSLSQDLVGEFTLSGHPILAQQILPALFKKISSKPALKLNIKLLPSRESLEAVRTLTADFCIAADPFDYPDLVIKRLWSEYSGLYSLNGKNANHLFYNNKMISSYKVVSEYPKHKVTAIESYDLIHSIVTTHPKSMALLPNPIVDQKKKLKLIKKVSKNIPICLAYRSDRTKTKAFQFLQKQIFQLGKEVDKVY